ncbi:hypothetical protein G6F65_016973 [Rhizopus arrhizus]|nr:hypothetical protein G6F65_016973 [Rhizopus arrhizus]
MLLRRHCLAMMMLALTGWATGSHAQTPSQAWPAKPVRLVVGLAPGGLVDMTTKRPTETPLHEIELQGGNFDRRQAAFDFAGPMDQEGKWLYRITGVARNSGTQVDHSPDDRLYLAPSLTWRPTDRTNVTVYASYQKSKRGGSEQSLPLTGTVYDNPAGRFPSDVFLGQPDLTHYTVENTSVGYEIEHAATENWTVPAHATARN